MSKVEPSLLEVLDRILDKGIVVDAWIRFSLVGLDLLTVQARIVVASIETYLGYTEAIKTIPLQSPPRQLPAKGQLVPLRKHKTR